MKHRHPGRFGAKDGAAEQLSRFRMQENRVVRKPVALEDFLQLRPDRIVALFAPRYAYHRNGAGAGILIDIRLLLTKAV